MPNVAELHRALYQAINSKDFDTVGALYHPECIYMVGDGKALRGADVPLGAAKSFANALPDLAIEIRQQYVPSESVSIVEYTFSGTHRGELEGIPATGKQVSVIACSIMEARDGKIIREHDYYDTMALLDQLGVAATS